MSTITISKKEYRELLNKKLKYEYLRQILRADIFSPPLTKNVKEIVKSFRATKLYNSQFIKSLERGIKRASYFNS